MSHLLLQMVVAMVLVVGGIWGFGKIMGRSRAAGRNAGRAAGGFLRTRPGSRDQVQGLTILSRQPVGKGKYLAVVQVGAQQFLVGIADAGLTPLGELHADDPDTPPGNEAHERPAGHGAGADVVPAPVPAFGPAQLASMDLGALGLRSVNLGAPGQTPRSVRSLVESLREATVRR